MKRFIAALLSVMLGLSLFTIGTGALAAERVSARTPLAGSAWAKVSNIEIAAARLDGVTVPYGTEFSFNDTVGPRTKAYGYQSALNGRGVKVTGGGVAQVASVIWLAVKNLDSIAIVEKSTYGSRYNQSYVASSNDAILTDYSDGTDFSFRNVGLNPITISTYVSGDMLCCDIYQN